MADLEVVEEALYKASRFWTHAANEWEAAADWLPGAALSSQALGYGFGVFGGSKQKFIADYNECVHQIRDLINEGAENLHGAAQALRTSAAEYVEIDGDLTRRIDRIIDPDEVVLPPEPDLGPAPGTPH